MLCIKGIDMPTINGSLSITIKGNGNVVNHNNKLIGKAVKIRSEHGKNIINLIANFEDEGYV